MLLYGVLYCMLGDPRCCHWQLRRLPVTSCILRRGTHRVLVLVAGGSVSNTYLQKRGKNHARNIRMFHSHGYVIYGATFLSQNFEHDARAFELRQLAFPIPSLVCSRSDHLFWVMRTMNPRSIGRTCVTGLWERIGPGGNDEC